MREGYLLTKKEASEIFIILSNARLKLNGKYKTGAEKYYRKFEETLIKEILKDEKTTKI